jgi:hypothetical protein
MIDSRWFFAGLAALLQLGLAACGGSVGQVSSGFTIGGSVADLRGSGLVLRNNDGDDLVVAASGTFTFPSLAAPGSPYRVTVAAQPSNPAQLCVVNNGTGTVSAASVTTVSVVCSGEFLETFGGSLGAERWEQTAQFARLIDNGALQLRLAAADRDESSTLDPVRLDAASGQALSPNAIRSLAADLTIATLVETGDAQGRAQLAGRFYNSPTGDARPDPADAGDQTGDVRAEVGLRGSAAFYRVVHCLNAACSRLNTLTPGDGFVPLGATGPSPTARLLLDWDNLNPNRFTFQRDGGPPVLFDPAAAGAPVAAPNPNSPRKWIGLITGNVDPGEGVDLTALYDNLTVNGVLHDDFGASAFLRGTHWNRSSSRVAVEQGRLVLEAGKQFTGNAEVDGALETTEIETRSGLFLPTAVVEGEITLDPATTVTQAGGSATEARAVLELDFQPPGAPGLERLFEVQAVLRQLASGASARLIAIGCGDPSCSPAGQLSIPGQVQDFTLPISPGVAHHVRIEHAGAGLFRVTLDRIETLAVDLSPIPQFAGAEFDRVRLRARVRDTDAAGEQAFVRALFDNVRVGP